MGSTFILVVVVVTAVAFDFTNGFHDTANAVATSIATGALKPVAAVIMSGCFNFLGAFISISVAATIAKGVVDPAVANSAGGLEIVLAALLGSSGVALAKEPPPYTDEALSEVAANCTAKADAARKVEREMSKRIAAVAMSGRIGEHFDAIVTGVTPRGTFVRILSPHVEGLLAQGGRGVDVGDKLHVTLVRTDAEHGFIDFARVAS